MSTVRVRKTTQRLADGPLTPFRSGLSVNRGRNPKTPIAIHGTNECAAASLDRTIPKQKNQREKGKVGCYQLTKSDSFASFTNRISGCAVREVHDRSKV
jgi:hypothetical protein